MLHTGPAERFLKWGRSTSKEKLERSERSERSVNRCGVQGPAVGSSEVVYICMQSDGTIRLSWDPLVTLSDHIPKIDRGHSRMQVEVIPNIQILHCEIEKKILRDMFPVFQPHNVSNHSDIRPTVYIWKMQMHMVTLDKNKKMTQGSGKTVFGELKMISVHF